MRVLGLDLGSRTCGVAVSDIMGMIARPVETIRFEEDDYEDKEEYIYDDYGNIRTLIINGNNQKKYDFISDGCF